MKILIVINSLGAGGAEYSQKAWWEYLLRQSIDFKIIVLQSRGEGIGKILSPELKTRTQRLEGGVRKQFFQIKQIIHSFKPDLVHSTLWKSRLLLRTLRMTIGGFVHLESLVNTPWVAERLNDPKIDRWKYRILKQIERWTTRAGTDHWQALTHTVAAHYEREFGLPPDRISVIPRGRTENPCFENGEIIREIRHSFDLSSRELLLVNVGRQEFQKGQDILLHALARLRNQYTDLEFKALILGREGHQTSRLKELHRALDIENRVVFTGHRYDIDRILAAADLFLFPSRYEGQGGALIEAMAAGVPVVCPDRSVFREVLGADYRRYLYEAGNKDAFTQKMAEFIKSNKMRKEAGKIVRRRFEEKFQIKKIHRRMLSMYKSIIKDHS